MGSIRKFAVLFLAVSALWAQPPAAPQQPPAAAPQPPATTPQAAPAQAAPAPVQMGALNLQNASLTEVIDQLARQLHINYIIDPSVKGGVTLNTYGDLRNV